MATSVESRATRRTGHGRAGLAGASLPAALAVASLGAGCGCPSFATAMSEFDSVAGWGPAKAEPETVAWADEAERMPLPIRVLEGSGLDVAFTGLFGIEPSKSKLNDPSTFARDRMLCFAEQALGHGSRRALALVRLSWVLDGDVHPLNQITALRGLCLLAADLGVDPLQHPLASAREQSDEALVLLWQAHTGVLRDAVAASAAGRALAPLPAEACLEALARAGEQVPPTPRDRRAQLLLVNYLAHRAQDDALRAAAGAALQACQRNLVADALRRALYEPRSGAVRDTAVRTCCALGDPSAVARVLRLVVTPRAAGAAGASPSDLDRDVRLTLVRLCGQLPLAVAKQGADGGPAPVEFLYDTIADAGVDRALQVAALEALATCLGRPVSFARAWADEWWSDYVLSRGGRA